MRRLLMLVPLLLTLMPGPLLAAGPQPAIKVVSVDSTRFPDVSVVFGAPGVPRVASDDLAVTEDGKPVAPADVRIAREASLPIGLVVAVDTSVAPAELEALKAALRSTLASLDPLDTVAWVTYGEKAAFVQAPSGDRAVLGAAIDGLTVAGRFTALNDGALTGIRVAAESMPAGRRAVVLLTDSGDNASGTPDDAPIRAAVDAGVVLHVLSFGNKLKPDNLIELARQTGGQVFILPRADDAGGALASLVTLLRQGWRASWRSKLQADNGAHTFSIGLRSNTAVKDDSRFTATQGKVTASFANLPASVPVAGKVTLALQISSPAPLAAVEFFVDGVSVGRSTAPPFSVDWDAASGTTGKRKVSARVIDAVGNAGEATGELTVASPFAITAAGFPASLVIGEDLKISALPDAARGTTVQQISKVDLLLDGRPMGSDVTAPFEFTVSTSGQQSGTARIVLRGFDPQGRISEAVADVRLAAPGRPAWVRTALIALAVVVALLGLALAIIPLALNKRRSRGMHTLTLENTGNLGARFWVKAEDSLRALRFEFAAPDHGVLVEMAAPDAAAPAGGRNATQSASGPAKKTQGGASIRGAAGSASKAVDVFSGLAVLIGNSLDAVAGLLPSNYSAPLRNLGSRVRGAMYSVRSVEAVPERIKGTASTVSGNVERMGQRVGVPAVRTPNRAAPVEMDDDAAETSNEADVADSSGQSDALSAFSAQGGWLATPEVAPGEQYAFTLISHPIRLIEPRNLSFVVLSRGETDAEPQVTQGTYRARAQGASAWAPAIAAAAVALVALVLVVVLINAANGAGLA